MAGEGVTRRGPDRPDSPSLTTMRKRLLRTLLLALALPAPRALAAQGRTAPLDGFVASVARLWTSGDAAAITELAPADGRIVLDLGTGEAGAVEARHAAA